MDSGIVSDLVEPAASTPERGDAAAWTTLIILMTAMIFSLVDRLAISLMVGPIKHDLNLTDGDMGLLSGLAFGLFYACMGLPLGMLADRWSRKGTILVGVAVWSAATAACGLATNFVQLAIARIGVGAGEAGLAPASYSLIYDLFPRKTLGRAMSIFQLGATLGSGAALVLVGAIYSCFEVQGGWWGLRPWQATFVAIALPGPVMLLLLSRISSPPRPRLPSTHQSVGLVRTLGYQWQLYMWLFLAMGGVLMVNYALLSWVPAIAQREFGMTPAAIGSRYGAIMLIVCALALIVGGWTADHLQQRGIRVAYSAIICVASFALVPLAATLFFVSSSTGFLVVIALMHFAITLPVGVAPALIQMRTAAPARSRVSALYVLIVNMLGLGVGPVLVGFLSDRAGGTAFGLRLSVATVGLASVCVAALAAAMLVLHERATGSADHLPL